VIAEFPPTIPTMQTLQDWLSFYDREFLIFLIRESFEKASPHQLFVFLTQTMQKMFFCCKIRCGAPIDTTVTLYLVNSLRPTDRKHADERRRSGRCHRAGHGRHDRGVRTGFRVGPHGSARGGQGRRGDLPPGAGTSGLPCRAPHGRSRPSRCMCPAPRPGPAACLRSLWMCALMHVPVRTCVRLGAACASRGMALAENWRPRAQDVAEWLAPGQVFGPQNPGQKPPVPLPYTNQGANLGKNKPEHIKKDSGHLMYPLQQVASRPLRRA
jgi:hypothetical protein